MSVDEQEGTRVGYDEGEIVDEDLQGHHTRSFL